MVLTRSRIGFPTARIRDAWRRAVLIAALLCGLFAVRVHAMEAPDSLGLARLAKAAGRSGTARMHVQWDGKWYTFSNMRFDATGLRGDARAKAVTGVSEVWEGNAPAAGIPWQDVTRLQVPGPRGHSRAPLVGALIGGLLSVPRIAGWPEGTSLTPMESIGAFGMFAILGALAGRGVSVLNPWHGPQWTDFP